MYSYEWDASTGGYILNSTPLAFSKEPRPVYYKELDILGFDAKWNYPKSDAYPLMWAEANNYYYRGRLVAKTKGGSICKAPELIFIEDPEPSGEELKFVDIPAMIEKNQNILESLTQEAIKKIYNIYSSNRKKYDIFYVAFSGGKDSIVTLDLVQRAIDYNADGYDNDKSKLAMIARLLPFVEKRINLIELAPKGTGKSYLFGRISKYGNLTAGVMSRAKLFYDLSKRTYGLIYNNDYVAFDEIQKLAFADPDEMSQTLKGYMEQGIVSFGGHTGTPEAGIILLGNIPQDNMNEFVPMFGSLPELFKESALLDRFHGFIKGWDIPRMTESMKICGWALNTAYFCEILHALRDDVSYRAVVDELLEYDANSDTRDVEAVKRIATGFMKLLFPNVRVAKDISPKDFKEYCVRPAATMRSIIKYQMGLLDKEYRGKDIPKFSIREIDKDDEDV